MHQGKLNQLIAIYQEVMFGHQPVNTMDVHDYCQYNGRLTKQRTKLQASLQAAAVAEGVSLPGPVTKALARVVQAKAHEPLGMLVGQLLKPGNAMAGCGHDYAVLTSWLSNSAQRFFEFIKEWEQCSQIQTRIYRQCGRKLTTSAVRAFNWNKFAMAVYLSAAQNQKQQNENRKALLALSDALEDATFSVAYANRQPEKALSAIKTAISLWENLLSETIRFYSSVTVQDIQKVNAIYQAWVAIRTNKLSLHVVYSIINEHPMPYMVEMLDDSVMGSIKPTSIVGQAWWRSSAKKGSNVRELFFQYVGAPLKFDRYPGVQAHLDMWRTKTQAAELHKKEPPHERFKPLLGTVGLTEVEAQVLSTKIAKVTKEHLEECNKERFEKLTSYRPVLGY